jgi:hypothetical protein
VLKAAVCGSGAEAAVLDGAARVCGAWRAKRRAEQAGAGCGGLIWFNFVDSI